MLQQLDQLAAKRVDFAFETTFSGLGYVRRIRAWKRAGYKIEIVYLKLQSIRLALTICGHRPFGECLVSFKSSNVTRKSEILARPHKIMHAGIFCR